MKFTDDAGTLSVDPLFAKQVETESLEEIRKCFQCGECTAGCPVAFSMDYTPNQVMRMAQLGLKERLLGCSSIWLCASCSTCAARCPRNVDLARVMDTLRAIAHREGVKPAEREVAIFHETVLRSLESEGRLNELKMIGEYKIRSLKLMQDIPMGMSMFAKGKLGLQIEKVRGIDEVRKLFKKKSGGKR